MYSMLEVISECHGGKWRKKEGNGLFREVVKEDQADGLSCLWAETWDE